MKKKSIFKKLTVLGVILTFVFTLVGCSQKNSEGKENSSANKTINTSEENVKNIAKKYPAGSKMELKFAKNFSIEYLEDGMKIVTDNQGQRMILLQKGQEVPEEHKDLSSITIPISDTIYTSTTQVGYLRAFEDESLFDSIVGVRAKIEDWDLDAIKTRMENGKIKDIGDNTTTQVSYNYEIMQSLNPKIVFTTQGMGDEQQKLMDMLNQAKIPYLMDGGSTESDYRGTMEWLKFYAAFYNLEDVADKYFDESIARIEEMKVKVEGSAKPKVGWGIVSMGKVYVENAGSKSAQMVRDAGAEYLFDDIGVGKDGVTSISVEELYNRLSKADIFLNRGMPKYGPDKKSIIDQAPVLADLACFKEDRVWQITDNFWSTYHNIDKKYTDLAAIFHPELYKDYKLENFILMPDNAN